MAARERTYPGHTDSSEPVALGAPLTPVALMQIATGFWAFKTLAAAHELDLFTRLAGGAETTAQELARELGHRAATGGDAADRLRVARPARTWRRHGYRNTRAQRAVSRARHALLLRRPGDDVRPAAVLGVGEAHGGDPHQPTDHMGPRARALHVRARGPGGARDRSGRRCTRCRGFTARTLGDAIDLDAATRLLDVGGGSGAFAIELCRRYPSLCATVFDLPHVIDIAADKIAEAELRDRIDVHGGDFFADALPPGHDVHLYSMIMHDWNRGADRAPAAQILRCAPERRH